MPCKLGSHSFDTEFINTPQEGNNHTPCGYWYKLKLPTHQTITNISWWQTTVCMYDNLVGFIPMSREAYIENGTEYIRIAGILFDTKKETWIYLGEINTLLVEHQPQCAALHNQQLYYYTYTTYTDTLHYYALSLFKFQPSKEPKQIDVFSLAKSNETDVYDKTKVYMLMDAYEQYLVCGAICETQAKIKISTNYGEWFDTEFVFPDEFSGFDGDLYIKIDSSKTCWILYVRGTPTTSLQLWKNEDLSAANFVKVWDHDFTSDSNLTECDVSKWIFDFSDGANKIGISYWDTDSQYLVAYTSEDHGQTFSITDNTFSFSSPGYGFYNGEYHLHLVEDTDENAYIAKSPHTEIFSLYSTLAYPSYASLGRHANNVVIANCAENFKGGYTQQIVFSNDYGDTWYLFNTPISLVSGVEFRLPTEGVYCLRANHVWDFEEQNNETRIINTIGTTKQVFRGYWFNKTLNNFISTSAVWEFVEQTNKYDSDKLSACPLDAVKNPPEIEITEELEYGKPKQVIERGYFVTLSDGTQYYLAFDNSSVRSYETIISADEQDWAKALTLSNGKRIVIGSDGIVWHELDAVYTFSESIDDFYYDGTGNIVVLYKTDIDTKNFHFQIIDFSDIPENAPSSSSYSVTSDTLGAYYYMGMMDNTSTSGSSSYLFGLENTTDIEFLQDFLPVIKGIQSIDLIFNTISFIYSFGLRNIKLDINGEYYDDDEDYAGRSYGDLGVVTYNYNTDSIESVSFNETLKYTEWGQNEVSLESLGTLEYDFEYLPEPAYTCCMDQDYPFGSSTKATEVRNYKYKSSYNCESDQYSTLISGIWKHSEHDRDYFMANRKISISHELISDLTLTFIGHNFGVRTMGEVSQLQFTYVDSPACDTFQTNSAFDVCQALTDADDVYEYTDGRDETEGEYDEVVQNYQCLADYVKLGNLVFWKTKKKRYYKTVNNTIDTYNTPYVSSMFGNYQVDTTYADFDASTLGIDNIDSGVTPVINDPVEDSVMTETDSTHTVKFETIELTGTSISKVAQLDDSATQSRTDRLSVAKVDGDWIIYWNTTDFTSAVLSELGVSNSDIVDFGLI